ncbi:MAG: adenosylcobinamide-GDP ribazoletransferase [Abditibacteriota bacterium]|nr:adenosylcobinamide-GDP ribazoletransferase [Abditibacteriota bacterium]
MNRKCVRLLKKKAVRSMVTALSVWTRLPVPQLAWKPENLSRSLCWMPLAGAVLGVIVIVIASLTARVYLPDCARGALIAAAYVLVTGGIHLDGFCDVTDALAACRDREERMRILKDPRLGAFAVIGLVCMLVFMAGVMGGLNQKGLYVCAIGFVLSRCFAAAALLRLPLMRDEGMAAAFQKTADTRYVRRCLIVIAVLCYAALAYISIPEAALCLLLSAGILKGFRRMTEKEFGGINGDTLGWLITVSEAVFAAAGLCL